MKLICSMLNATEEIWSRCCSNIFFCFSARSARCLILFLAPPLATLSWITSGACHQTPQAIGCGHVVGTWRVSIKKVVAKLRQTPSPPPLDKPKSSNGYIIPISAIIRVDASRRMEDSIIASYRQGLTGQETAATNLLFELNQFFVQFSDLFPPSDAAGTHTAGGIQYVVGHATLSYGQIVTCRYPGTHSASSVASLKSWHPTIDHYR